METLGLGLHGNVYDPNLLEYRADLEFGLSQDRFRESIDRSTEAESDSGFLTRYDVSVDALKTKPISLNAYARRFDDRIPRRFLPSLHEWQTETGASALIVAGPFTTELGFSLRNVDRTGNRLEADDEELRTRRFYLDHKWAISATQQLHLSWDHEYERSDYQGTLYEFTTRRDEVRLDHELQFGPESKHRLDTYFRHNAESGDLARNETELVPRLTLQHTDKFKTIHRYGFYEFQQGGIEVSQHKFDTEAVYAPNDRWRLTADGFGLYERMDQDVDTSEFGGSFDVAYDQPTAMGKLSANAAFGYDHSRTVGDAGRRFVHDEAHQLGGVRPVFLRERGVVPGSTTAHDANRMWYYVAGVDYVASTIGGRTLVQRLPTGRIAENNVVYFDYAYVVPAHAEMNSYRSDFLIEHAFNFGLTPYYGYEGRCQEIDSSRATQWSRDNTHRHRLGLRFERDRWSTGTEYEIFDDTVEPYTAYHLTGRAGLLSTPEHTVDCSAELSRYLFEGGLDDRRVWWLDADLTGRSKITQYLWLKADTAFRWEDDSVNGETDGVDIKCGFEFRRGLLTVELTIEYDLLALARGREDGLGLYLNVRRDLTELLPSARRSQ